jgi:hypothetical protein
MYSWLKSMYMYMYMYVYICIYTCICIHLYCVLKEEPHLVTSAAGVVTTTHGNGTAEDWLAKKHMPAPPNRIVIESNALPTYFPNPNDHRRTVVQKSFYSQPKSFDAGMKPPELRFRHRLLDWNGNWNWNWPKCRAVVSCLPLPLFVNLYSRKRSGTEWGGSIGVCRYGFDDKKTTKSLTRMNGLEKAFYFHLPTGR